MNKNTRVSVHCYEGDAKQVADFLPLHLHHRCPVTILSPADSPVVVEHPGVDCKFVGKRQSMGQLSLDRQRAQMRELLTYPEDFFYMNDADSVCLSPKFPDYLYHEPNVLWSNLVYDPIAEQQKGYPPGFPRLAFQPPYFLSRYTIERLLSVAEGVQANPVMPYIDHYMVQLAVRAQVVWKGFPDGISAPISTDIGSVEHTQVAVRHKGVIFIHSVKDSTFLNPLIRAHEGWLGDYRPAANYRLNGNTDTTADVRPVGNELARDKRIVRDLDHVYREKPPGYPPMRDSIGRLIRSSRSTRKQLPILPIRGVQA